MHHDIHMLPLHKTLVLNHVIPGALLELPDEAFFEGIRLHFDGEIILGKDQMVI